jgi:hypothetical protein
VLRWSGSRRRLFAAFLAGCGAVVAPLTRGSLGRGEPRTTENAIVAQPPSATASPAAAAPLPAPVVRVPASPDPLAVQKENALPGSNGWRITNYAAAGEIQAYAGQASVNTGETLDLHVSTRAAGVPYRIDWYRMGWYGGAGARLLGSVTGLRGQAQGYYTAATGLTGARAARYDAQTGLLDVNWVPAYRLQIPANWLSGVYLALLTAEGKQTYVPFVVRQDERPSALLLKSSFNTFQAYNAWGGKSLYSYNSTGANTAGGGPGAVKVSFNRPFDADFGSGEFLRYEYNLLRWIERMGYDVAYAADGDLAANGGRLLEHQGFISTGHDEYWTAEQRDNVEQARSVGTHLAFLCGDAVYWQARYEPSADGAPRRTLVVYRCDADPLYHTDPPHTTVRWQDPPVNRPQHMLTGTLYAGQTDPFTQDWVVADTSSPLFSGTGLKPGDHVKGLVGKEFDGVPRDMLGPPGLQVLGHSGVTVAADDRPPNVAYADTTVYTAPSGAMVFSAGTVTWSWGLDDTSFPLGALHNTPVSPAIQRLTQNLLDAFVSPAD